MQLTRLDPVHPRPQLVRADWQSLDGAWRFGYDDSDVGLIERWYDPGDEAAGRFDREIVVPFPPESKASGVGDPGFHPVVWYRRTLTAADLGGTAGQGTSTLVRFGAVDHRARVWFDGALVGEHVGGQTPFSVDVTPYLDGTDTEHVLVVRAEDDPHDAAQPRGKQDWQPEPHGIWYQRTTGIWQTVWVERVPRVHLAEVGWTPDLVRNAVRCDLVLSERPPSPRHARLTVSLDGEEVASQQVSLHGPRASTTVDLSHLLANAQDRDRYLWAPEHPVLFDARLELAGADGSPDDVVDSYFGVRSAEARDGHFQLNGLPYYVRSVLDQGYWPDTHLANPGPDWLREEVELIKAMGFNAVRVHQKAEDPRLLAWADRLGLLVWGETANAYEFSPTAVDWLTREWLDLVRRDRSHPSVVTWVPINESWGVQDIAVDPAQQAYSVGLASLTRALDPTRPVVSNEGWQHLDSDILGLHDYTSDGAEIVARYGDAAAVAATLESAGPAGRAPVLSSAQRARFDRGEAPLMITEFGGVSYASDGGTWGYSTVSTDEEYADLLGRLFDALRSCDPVVGFCYTQLLDTLQEANGLATADRTPKLPLDTIRRIVTGEA